MDLDGRIVFRSSVISPIISKGEAIGAVIIAAKDIDVGEMETKLSDTAALFLARQMKEK